MFSDNNGMKHTREILGLLLGSWILTFYFLIADAVAVEVLKLGQTGLQPTIITPQGNSETLYSESYALLISESNYQSGWRTLDATASEMDQLSDVLRKQGFNVWRVKDATGGELRKVLRDFISENDAMNNRLLVFYSGHGYTNPRNDFAYLVPVDAADPNKSFPAFQKAALPIAELEVLAQEVTARHTLLVFDSCFSGAIFTTRGVSGLDRDASENRWRYLTGKSTEPVRQFIAAGGPKEELPAKSVFLPLLLKALDGAAARVKDGYVTGKEIGLYLEQSVPEFNKYQHPHSDVIKIPAFAFGDVVFQYSVTPPQNVPSIPPLYPGSYDEYKGQVASSFCLEKRIPAKTSVKVSIAGSWYAATSGRLIGGPFAGEKARVSARSFSTRVPIHKAEEYKEPLVFTVDEDFEICVQLPSDNDLFVKVKPDDILKVSVQDTQTPPPPKSSTPQLP